MTFYDVMTTEYWGVPLWGWILIVLGLIGLIMGIRGAMAKKKDDTSKTESSPDPEAGNVKLPEASPPKSPDARTQEFPRDAPLPPPAPSETSEKGKP